MRIANVLTIGDEILRGRTVNSNFGYIAKKMFDIGVGIRFHKVVSDNLEDIANALSELQESADYVFVTGGLGPTPDDMTRAALAKYLNVELVANDLEYEKMRKRFEKRGIDMAPSNRTQILFPEGTEPLLNTEGMAPGIYFTHNNTQFWFVPGVPREMKAIVDRVTKELDIGYSNKKLVFRTSGIPESTLYDIISDKVKEYDKSIGYYPSLFGVDIVIRDENAEKIAQIIEPHVKDYCFSNKEEELMAEVIQRELIDRSETLSLAESCTGGMLSSMFVDIPGSSVYYKGGVVSYSNEIKQHIIDVPKELLIAHGAVSAQVAGAMAKGVLKRFKTDYALAITGIAGPNGATDDKPVGLVYIALATKDKVYCRRNTFANNRTANRKRTCSSAMLMLWQHLNGKLESTEILDGAVDVSNEVVSGK